MDEDKELMSDREKQARFLLYQNAGALSDSEICELEALIESEENYRKWKAENALDGAGKLSQEEGATDCTVPITINPDQPEGN